MKPPPGGPSTGADHVAPVRSCSQMLQQTEQDMNNIGVNTVNTVPAVQKHVSFHTGTDVHDISMISTEGSPLRDRIVHQDVLAMRQYTADGNQVIH